jgi:hypothetical protein
MSEWLLFNAKCAIFRLYYDEKKIGWDDDNVDIPFVLDEHA